MMPKLSALKSITGRSVNQGIAAMILSVSLIAIGAAAAKVLLDYIPTNQVLWLRFVGYTICMAPMTWALHSSELVNPYRKDHQIYRGVLAVGVALFFLLGLKTVDISLAVAVFYIYPIFMCVGGILFLGERAAAPIWAALLASLLGVVLIVKPTSASFDIGMIFLLLAAALVGARMVLHRHNSENASILVAAFWERGIGTILTSITLLFAWEPITSAIYGPVAILITATVAAQVLLVYAISCTSLVNLAPYTYWEVIFALLVGVFCFGDTFDIFVGFGILLVIVSGVWVAKLRAK